MPLFSTSLENQQQAASAGVKTYPALSESSKNFRIVEKFNRATLNPSGFPAFYTTGGNGTPVVNTSGNAYGGLLLNTSGVIGDDTAVVSAQAYPRSALWAGIDSTSQLEADFIWDSTSTNIEFFIGLVYNTAGILTALPTTARHLGIYVDQSAGANYMLTSANGTTQATTDTGVAVAGATLRINIVWSGNDSAVIRLFSGTNLDTLRSTHTVTSLGFTVVNPMFIHFFVQTEATAAKGISLYSWQMQTQ